MFFNQPKTVSSVLASFEQTIVDLREIDDREMVNVNNIEVEIAQLEAAKQNSLQESTAARTIATKLANLISA